MSRHQHHRAGRGKDWSGKPDADEAGMEGARAGIVHAAMHEAFAACRDRVRQTNGSCRT